MTIYTSDDIKAIAASKSKSLRWRVNILTAMASSNRKVRRAVMKTWRKNRRKPKNRHRNRGFALDEMELLTDSQFKEMFRIDKNTFDWLEEEIDPFLRRDEVKAKASSGTAITTRTRLAITLRWLAGGSHIDLCFAWGISKSSFFSDRGALWPTIEALDDVLDDIGFPIDNDFELEEMRQSFNVKNNGVLDGIVMAIDGIIIRTRCPTKKEVKDPKSYAHRKGGFGLLVMAGCDGNTKFRSVTAKHTGSTNDHVAWEMSDLADALHNGELKEPYFIIGDEAFTCLEYLLVPWHGRGIGTWKDSFNYWLSHSRQCIERAFGMLISRWGIYWRKFRFSYNRWSLVIKITMKLHNLCVDRRLAVPQRRYREVHERGDSCVVINNTRDDDHALIRRARADKRKNFTEALQEAGTGRPQHAHVNSRSGI